MHVGSDVAVFTALVATFGSVVYGTYRMTQLWERMATRVEKVVDDLSDHVAQSQRERDVMHRETLARIRQGERRISALERATSALMGVRNGNRPA